MATGYTVCQYGGMIACEPRMDVFAEALRRAITPGCTVIDLGAGTSVFALLACQYGAGRVIAIEPADAVQVLRISARDNGYADRIEVIQDLSTAFTETNVADVIVSDLRGCLPLFERHIPILIDARERLLKPGGVLMPQRDILRVALCCHPEYGALCEEPWLRNSYGLDLSAGHRFAVNRFIKTTVTPETLRSAALDLLTIDYRTVTVPDFEGRVVLECHQAGPINGLLLWFDAEIAPDLGFSNAPGKPQLVYESAFFPFEHPIDMATGDWIELDMRARFADGEYLWTWTSTLYHLGSDMPEKVFRQNSFLETALTAKRLRGSPAAAAAL